MTPLWDFIDIDMIPLWDFMDIDMTPFLGLRGLPLYHECHTGH